MFYFQQSQQTWSKSFVFCLNSKPIWIPALSLILSNTALVTYFTTLYLTVHGPPSVMIPSLVKNVTELVDDGTNFNNCFLNETSQFTCKVCGNTSQECFPTKHVYTSTNTACSQNKTLFSCEAYFILLGTWTLLRNKKLLMRFISDKPW